MGSLPRIVSEFQFLLKLDSNYGCLIVSSVMRNGNICLQNMLSRY